MSNQVEIPQEQAMDLLNKWMTENRVIRLSLKAGNGFVRMLVRIDGLKNGTVYFSARKAVFPLGMHYTTELALDNCRFGYAEGGSDASSIECDALLFIYYFDPTMTFRADASLCILPLVEWSQF